MSRGVNHPDRSPYRPHPHPAVAPMHAPQPPAPQGVIDLTLQGSEWTSNIIPPTVLVNGYQITSGYGRHQVAVAPGPVRIEVYAQWIRRYGQAALDVFVRPGDRVPVFYASPYHQFTTGSIGHVPQQRRGRGAMIGIIAGLVAATLAVVGAILMVGLMLS